MIQKNKISCSLALVMILYCISFQNILGDVEVFSGNQEILKSLKKLSSIFETTFSGYLKSEAFWDSRQVFGLDDDQCLIAPEKKVPDRLGKDINSKGQFQQTIIESYLNFNINGPEVGRFKTRVQLETYFFGQNEIFPLLTIYTAFIQFISEKLDIIAGQDWHPVFSLDVYPHTISFNSGIPIEIFERNPQIKFMYHTGPWSLTFAAVSQLTFTSDGPIGFSDTYLRNAVLPNLASALQYKTDELVVGTAISFKRLVPRLVSNKNFKVNERINSWGINFYGSYVWPKFNLRLKVNYFQNGSEAAFLGGYAVHAINPITDEREYTNITGAGVWIDFDVTKYKKVVPGLFFGYVKNLGADDSIVLNQKDDNGIIIDRRIFGLLTDADQVIRISPRLRWNIKEAIMLGVELEHTRATYGDLTEKGSIVNKDTVANTRLLLAMYYFF